LELPTYAVSPADCQFDYKLKLIFEGLSPQVSTSLLSEVAKPLPDFITMNEEGISIWTDDSSIVGVYNFRVVATETTSKLVNSSVKFSVTIKCRITKLWPIITLENLKEFEFEIRGDTKTIKMPNYVYLPATCVQIITFKLENTSDGADQTVFPTFLKFDPVMNTVSLSGGKYNESDRLY